MSCPEVVYQAYYPYLYQRPPATATSAARTASFPHFPHQYDRFNVQRSLEQPSTPSHSQSSDTYHPQSSHHSSAGSVSSGGGGVGSPESPPARHSSSKEDAPPNTSSEGISSRNLAGQAGADDDDDDEDVTSPGGSRAQYVSANCVVFTHYSGDVESVVDEHFSRALSCTSGAATSAAAESNKTSTSNTKESSPLTSRNLPASFWNSHYQGATSGVTPHPGDFYSDPPMYHSPSAAASDPWHTHYQQYTAAAHHHHRAVHEYHHHHNMAAQYSSLLLPPTSRLPHQYHHSKAGVEPWTSGHSHHRLHHDQTGSIDPAATYSTYSTMAGLEAQVQESSKDLYWF